MLYWCWIIINNSINKQSFDVNMQQNNYQNAYDAIKLNFHA